MVESASHSPVMSKSDKNKICVNILNNYKAAIIQTCNSFEHNNKQPRVKNLPYSKYK